MKVDNQIVVHINQCHSLGNIESKDFEFAAKYIEKFRKEFIELKADEIDMDDIACAVLNGIVLAKTLKMFEYEWLSQLYGLLYSCPGRGKKEVS